MRDNPNSHFFSRSFTQCANWGLLRRFWDKASEPRWSVSEASNVVPDWGGSEGQTLRRFWPSVAECVLRGSGGPEKKRIPSVRTRALATLLFAVIRLARSATSPFLDGVRLIAIYQSQVLPMISMTNITSFKRFYLIDRIFQAIFRRIRMHLNVVQV